MLHRQLYLRLPWKFGKVWSIILKVTGQFRLTRKVTRNKILGLNTTATSAQYNFFFFFFIWYLAENERENIVFSKIPVIKGVYKTLFYNEYKVIMLFLPRGICSKRQNTLYIVWIYTREKLTIINTGLFRARHLNYGSNVSQYLIKVWDISVNSQPFFM